MSDDLNTDHRIPKGDAWRLCILRSILDRGQRLWIVCESCQRSEYRDAPAWIAAHHIELDTPLLTVSRRIRCVRCWRCAVTVRAEPFDGNHGGWSCVEGSPKPTAPCIWCGSRTVQQLSALATKINWDRPQSANRAWVQCWCRDVGAGGRARIFNAEPVGHPAVAPLKNRLSAMQKKAKGPYQALARSHGNRSFIPLGPPTENLGDAHRQMTSAFDVDEQDVSRIELRGISCYGRRRSCSARCYGGSPLSSRHPRSCNLMTPASRAWLQTRSRLPSKNGRYHIDNAH